MLIEKGLDRSSRVVQWVKDRPLSLQLCRSLLWHGFDPWPANFCMLCGAAKTRGALIKKNTGHTYTESKGHLCALRESGQRNTWPRVMA